MSPEFASRRQIVDRTFCIQGADSSAIGVTEVPERDQVVIHVQDGSKQGLIATVRLNFAQWEALCGLKYDVDIHRPSASEVEA